MQVIHFVILLPVVLNYHAIICCHFVTVHSSSMAWNFSKTNQESCFCTYLFSSQKRDASHIYVKTLVIWFSLCIFICSIEDAKRLIDLIEGIPCKINLISFNPHTGSQFQPTSDAKMIEFRNVLAEAGCTVFLRPSRGDDQMAACGQLGNPGAIQAPLLRVPKQFQTALNISVWLFSRRVGWSRFYCLNLDTWMLVSHTLDLYV